MVKTKNKIAAFLVSDKKYLAIALDKELHRMYKYVVQCQTVHEAKTAMTKGTRACKQKKMTKKAHAALVRRYEKECMKRDRMRLSVGVSALAAASKVSLKKERGILMQQLETMCGRKTLKSALNRFAHHDLAYNAHLHKELLRQKKVHEKKDVVVTTAKKEKPVAEETTVTEPLVLDESYEKNPERYVFTRSEFKRLVALARKEGFDAVSTDEENAIKNQLEHQGVTYHEAWVDKINVLVRTHTRDEIIELVDAYYPLAFRLSDDGVPEPSEAVQHDPGFAILYAAYQLKALPVYRKNERAMVQYGTPRERVSVWRRLFATTD